jgi:hypothetical protein
MQVKTMGACLCWPSPATSSRDPAPKHKDPSKLTINSVKNEEKAMPTATVPKEKAITREQLVALLNEDLAREYQAIIAYVN